jgi:hypothetical protein
MLPTTTSPGTFESNGAVTLLLSPFKTLGYIIRLFILILKSFFNLLTLIFLNLHWILLGLILVTLTIFWFSGHKEITENVEFLWRCHIYPIWEEIVRPIFEMFVEFYEKLVCWYNAQGLINRLLSNRIILRTLRRCDNISIFEIILNFGDFLVELISKPLIWFFTVNNLESTFPGYSLFITTVPVVQEFEKILTCLCEDLRFLWLWLIRIWTDELLSCAFHQVVNFFVSIYQLVVNFVIDVIRLAADVFAAGGGFTEFIEALSGGGEVGFVLPSTTPTLERINAFANIMGRFLDNAIEITLCTGEGIIEGNGNNTLADIKYEECIASDRLKFNFFCWIGPWVSLITRFETAIFQLGINSGTILSDLINKPAGNRYLLNNWILRVDYFLDTLRIPAPRFNYTLSLQNPTIIAGSGQSSIVQPNPQLYGDYTTIPINITCNATNTNRTIIPCEECNYVQDEDVETCLCKIAEDLDNITSGFFGFKIFDGLLCCLVGRSIRVVVEIARYIIVFVTYVFNYDRIGEFLTDQNHLEIIITELVGRPKVLEGILECVCRVMIGLDVRLQCLCDFFVRPIKAIAEVFRMFIITTVRLANDLVSTDEPGFFQYLCVSNPDNCIDLEDVFIHLRKPRDNIFPNTNFTYVPVNTSYPDNAWVDCFCEIVSFQFANQFLDNPIEDLPDFCCGLLFGFRAMVEVVKFGIELILTVFDALGSVLDSNRTPTLTTIKYLACESIDLCWNGPEIVSDLEDMVQCPCQFLTSLEIFVSPSQPVIFCLCDFIDGFSLTSINLLKFMGTGGSALAQLMDCLGTDFPNPPCISDLAARFLRTLDYLIEASDTLGLVVKGAGCVVGSIFRFDCVGTPFYPNAGFLCNGSATLGKCAPSDRTGVLFLDAYRFVTELLRFFIRLGKNLIELAFSIAISGPGLPLSISELLRELLLSIGDPLFGTSGDPPTEGIFQSFGLWLNCILGPPTDSCTNETDPNEGRCFGDLFWRLGTARFSHLNY